MTVSRVFDKFADAYDDSRKRLIPCFEDFYGIALAVIPFAEQKAIRVLDLGAGTGLFTSLVGERYPNAEFVLTDVSERMLAQARERLAGMADRCGFQLSDYAKSELAGPFDLVISALSIHHLADPDKQNLFARIYKTLSPGGMFINADQALGESEEIEKEYRAAWLAQVRKLGTSEEELAAALERMQEDRMAPLSAQLDWLRGAGFSEINCWYKNFSFVVYSGRHENA